MSERERISSEMLGNISQHFRKSIPDGNAVWRSVGLAIFELEERRQQRCETCVWSLGRVDHPEVDDPNIECVGCDQRNGEAWPLDGYCHVYEHRSHARRYGTREEADDE